MHVAPNKNPASYQLLLCFVLLTGLLAAGPGVCSASAYQPTPADPDTTRGQDQFTVNTSAGHKSPTRAVLYSTLGTAVLVPLTGVGFVVGPSFGHFYAGNRRKALTGIAIRTASVAAGGTGVLLSFGTDRTGPMLVATGVLVLAGSVLYDTATAWTSAEEYNESHDIRASVTPTVDPAAKQGGLTLNVTF